MIESAVRRNCSSRRLVGISFAVPRKMASASSGEISAATRMPIFACSSSLPLKARLAIRKETVKPTPAAAPVPSRPGQVIVSLPPPKIRRVATQGAAKIPSGLPTHVGEDDADRDRRGGGGGDQVAGQVDAGVGEGEERHDHVAGPGVQRVLQALVRRDRLGQAAPRRGGQPRRRLLAELAGQVGRPVELLARGRVGAGDQPDRQPGDHRVDPRLVHRDPDRDPDDDRQRAAVGRQEAQRGEHGEEPDRDRQRHRVDRLGVDEDDDPERGEVVDDDQGEEEDPQPGGAARRRQGEGAERQRRVGRHRHPPAVGAVAAAVDQQVDRDRRGDAAERRRRRDPDPGPLAQLAEVELALGLEPDDEEEQRHQPLVDPGVEVGVDPVRADLDAEVGRPEVGVGAGGDVRPSQRCEDRGDEDDGAAGLGAEEVAHRRRQVAGPGGALGVGLRVGRHSRQVCSARAGERRPRADSLSPRPPGAGARFRERCGRRPRWRRRRAAAAGAGRASR